MTMRKITELRGVSVEDTVQSGPGQVAFRLSNGRVTDTVALPPGPEGQPGRDGANVLPTDEAIAQAIQNADSETAKALAEVTGSVGQPVDAVVTFGDSLTESTGTDWPTTVLGPELGVPVVNMGKSGWASSDVAVRQGGLRPRLTVSGNQIPGSGPVAVTAVIPDRSFRSDGTGAFTWRGTLAGVHGTLTHSMTGDSWTFTRTTSGNTVACPPGTEFVGADSADYVRTVQTFWTGRNNLTSGPELTDVVGDTDFMTRHVGTSPQRYVVLGVMPRADYAPEFTGGQTRQLIEQVNEWLRQRHGEKFLDIGAAIVERGLAIAGITATAADLADMARGVPPVSLRAAGDHTHLNTAGYSAVGKLVADRIKRLGYVPGRLPAVVPGRVSGLSAGSASQSTQALSWQAVSGALGYRVEYRPTGGTWGIATVATGTTATVAGLSVGTEYEYQVAAQNVAGTGAVSAAVTARTAGVPAEVVLSDSFNRADSDSLGSADAALGGSSGAAWATTSQIGIRSNRAARVVDPPTSTRFAHIDAQISDGYVEAIVRLGSSADVSIIGRWTDQSNMYRVIAASTGLMSLGKVVAGSNTTLASSQAGAVKSGDRLGLRVIGTTLQAVVNGVVVLEAEDSSHTSATRWGFQLPPELDVPSVDDFKVYDK